VRLGAVHARDPQQLHHERPLGALGTLHAPLDLDVAIELRGLAPQRLHAVARRQREHAERAEQREDRETPHPRSIRGSA
jgi:hypothetical protein